MLFALEQLGSGRLITIDADPARQQEAVAAFERLYPGNGRVQSVEGRFEDVLPGVLAELDGPLDLVYEDGPHIPEITIESFEQAWPHVRAYGLMVFDDVRFPTGNERAWRQIRNHRTVAASLELNGRIGICLKKRRYGA
jgi:predicted O-methyltransferase YrrM